MRVVLDIKSKRAPAQRVHLRARQAARFGRSEWADYSFVHDLVMSEMHFELRCGADDCRVRNLGEGETLINGKKIEAVTQVHDGDEIRAGETRFMVNIEGGAAPSTATAEQKTPPPPTPIAPVAALPATLVATCTLLELSRDVQQFAQQVTELDDLIARLIAEDQFLDAMRLRAYYLPKRDAIWWGCLCVQEVLDSPLESAQQDALAVAVQWVREPNEPHRREAEKAANEVRSQGVGGLLALSTFWSGGSIGAEDGPEIPADDRLVCQGVSAALITAAYHGDASQSTQRLNAFLALGKEVADGKRPIEVAQA